MRRSVLIFAALASTAVVVAPIVYYSWEEPSADPLGEKLRGYGFLPIEPPSTLMDVGSLYYVSEDARDFRSICRADRSDVLGVMDESHSWQIEQDLKQQGTFTVAVDAKMRPRANWTANGAFLQTVHFSLTDVLLDEISIGQNGLIFGKLMNKPDCNAAAMQLLKLGGYVCQGQKVLRARAEIKVDRETKSNLAGSAQPTFASNKDGVNADSSATGDRSIVEREGLPFADAVLTYGVEMNPLCLAPQDARFARTLPSTKLGRAYSFVLFRLIEPILPHERPQLDVAQTALDRTR